jgi:hypothetical protein
MLRSFIAFISVFVIVMPSLYASVALKLSNKELAQKADEILIGTVKDISYIIDEKQKTPYTITTITVDKWIKGRSNEKEIKVRQIGGKFKDQQLFITGDARLNQGERVLLFLTKGEEYRFLLALSQAKFSIVMDERLKEEVVVRDMSSLGLARFNSEGKLEVENPQPEKPIRLKDFIKEIESYIKQ